MTMGGSSYRARPRSSWLSRSIEGKIRQNSPISEVPSLKSQDKSTSPVAPFAVGDLVAYAGSKKRYLGKVGTVHKVKVDACQVQFFDDPLMPNGGPKTIRFVFRDLRHHRPSNPSIPKPQLVQSPPPLP
jgi:hypothetical protein